MYGGYRGTLLELFSRNLLSGSDRNEDEKASGKKARTGWHTLFEQLLVLATECRDVNPGT